MFATKKEIIDVIQKIKEEHILILVEGKKDKAALQKLGLTNIVILNGKDIWNRLEGIKAKEVLILTDFDKQGKKLYYKIAKDLEQLHIKVNKKYREFFQKKTKLSQIEGMDTYIENLEQ
ncbi:MAG: toprim domain-containing protein [Candidatus Woesearchaeota archaeon]|jgi:5S rRNA maturation endonuclease (ribonuclease M5)